MNGTTFCPYRKRTAIFAQMEQGSILRGQSTPVNRSGSLTFCTKKKSSPPKPAYTSGNCISAFCSNGLRRAADQPGARQPVDVRAGARHPRPVPVGGKRRRGHAHVVRAAGSKGLLDPSEPRGDLRSRGRVEEVDARDLPMVAPELGQKIPRLRVIPRTASPRTGEGVF